MSQTVPDWLDAALAEARDGHARLSVAGLASAEVLGRDGFSLSSPAFSDGGMLDPSFTAEEEDAVAPPLEWTAAPEGAHELALIVEHPESRTGDPSCHWLVWGLPPHKGKLLEGEVPALVGKNAHGNSEWLLPDPPSETGPHDYVFQLFALDRPLDLMPGATREELVAAIEGHVLAAAVLTGRYQRQIDAFLDSDALADDDDEQDDWDD